MADVDSTHHLYVVKKINWLQNQKGRNNIYNIGQKAKKKQKKKTQKRKRTLKNWTIFMIAINFYETSMA